jgi:hypothetical protein
MIGWFKRKGPSGPSPETVELVQSSTVSDVLALVGKGKVSRSDALAAEEAGKGRATLLRALSE